MPPKAKANAQPSSAFTLTGRPYQSAFGELFKTTFARPADIDAKAIQLLDAFQEAGRIEEVSAHLKTSLTDVPREKVSNWTAFIFTLLKKFDAEFYQQMRDQRGRPRPHMRSQNVSVTSTKLRATAPEFVPGQQWSGRGSGTNGATPISLDGATSEKPAEEKPATEAPAAGAAAEPAANGCTAPAEEAKEEAKAEAKAEPAAEEKAAA